jgi:hypothetical protein
MDIYERERAKQRNVCAAEERVQVVRGDRGAEKHESGREERRRSQRSEQEGEKRGLHRMLASTRQSAWVPTCHNLCGDSRLQHARGLFLLLARLALLDFRRLARRWQADGNVCYLQDGERREKAEER